MSVRYRSCVQLLSVHFQCLDEKSGTNFHFICSDDNLLGYDSRIEICSFRVHFLKGIMKRYKRYFCLGSKMGCGKCLTRESAARWWVLIICDSQCLEEYIRQMWILWYVMESC